MKSKKFKIVRKNTNKSYKVPWELEQLLHIKVCGENGIFFDGEYYSRTFLLTLTESVHAGNLKECMQALRYYDTDLQFLYCRNQKELYLTIRTEAENFDDACIQIEKLEKCVRDVLVRQEAADMKEIDGNDRLRLIHGILKTGLSDTSINVSDYFHFTDWKTELQRKAYMDAGRELIKCEQGFLGVYFVQSFSKEQARELYEQLLIQPNCIYLQTTYESISDEAVAAKLNSMCMGYEKELNQIKKRDPHWYQALTGKTENMENQRMFTYCSVKYAMLFPTEGAAQHYTEKLAEMEQKYSCRILPYLRKKQYVLYDLLPLLNTKKIQGRVTRTSNAANFLPFYVPLYEREEKMSQKEVKADRNTGGVDFSRMFVKGGK